jgi:hypothetical protein
MSRPSFLPPVEELARWAGYLSRLSRRPRTFKITRGSGGNMEQECARRRRFHERHRTAIGGGKIWPG